MRCPKCGSENVNVQTYQEQTGSKTKTKYHFKASEKKHGCLWWMFIGWWWWMIDFMLWIFLFPFKFIYSLFYKKKKYNVDGSSTAKTKNRYSYTTVCVCQNCGKRWER